MKRKENEKGLSNNRQIDLLGNKSLLENESIFAYLIIDLKTKLNITRVLSIVEDSA